MQLADTSAWVWTRAVGGELRTAFDEDVIEGQVATCDMVRLELLYSARNATEFTSLRVELDALPNCEIGFDEWRRALEVYEAGRRTSADSADSADGAGAEGSAVPPRARGCHGSRPLYFLLEMTAVAMTNESATSAPRAPSQLTPTVFRT